MALNEEDQRMKTRIMSRLDSQARDSILQQEYARDEPPKMSEILKEKQLRNRALQPHRTSEIFDGLPEGLAPIFRDGFDSSVLEEAEPWLKTAANHNPWNEKGKEYANMFEEAFNSTQGHASLEFLMSLEPEDLEMVRSFGDMGLAPEMWGAIETAAQEVQHRTTLEKAREQQYQADVEARVQALDRRANFASNFNLILNPSTEIPARLLGTDISTTWDQLSDEQKWEAAAAQIEREHMDNTEPPTPDKLDDSLWNDLADHWVGGVKTIGSWIKSEANKFPVLEPSASTMEQMVDMEGQSREYEQAKEEISALYRTDDQLLAAAQTASFLGGEELFDSPDLEQIAPGIKDQYMAMAGGNVELARMLFAGAFADKQEETDQLRLGEELRDMHLAVLEEEEFEMTDRVLNTLGMLDKYTASTMATASVLFLSDEDARSDIFQGKIGDFYDKIKEVDHRPSTAMGLENTWAGLILDVSGSMMFDLTNVFLVGKGAQAAGRIRSASMAEAAVKAGPGKLVIEDIVNAILKGDRAALSFSGRGILEANPALFDELDMWVRRADDAVDTDVLGPGLNKEVSNELTAIRDGNFGPAEGLNTAGGVDATVASTLKDKANKVNTRVHLNVPGPYNGGTPATIVDDAGTEWHAYHVPGSVDADGIETIVWMNDQQQIGGGLYWSKEKGTAGMMKMGFEGSGLMKETVDVLRDGVLSGAGNNLAAEAIIAASKDASMTPAGHSAVKGMGKHLIDTAGDRTAAVRSQLDIAQVERVVEQALKEGADLGGAKRNLMATAFGAGLARDLSAGQETFEAIIKRNLRPTRSVTTWVGFGPHAYREAMDNTYYIWGQNVDKAHEWAGRLLDARRTSVNQLENLITNPLYHRAEAMAEQLKALDQEIGTISKLSPDNVPAELMAQKAATEQRLLEAQIELRKQYPSAQGADLGVLVNEMYEDFNREVIAKLPGWQSKIDPETGLVPWDELRVGGLAEKPALQSRFTDDMLEAFDDTVESKHLNALLEDIAGPEAGRIFTTPLSPLDLIAAGTLSGQQYRKFMNMRWLGGLRSGVQSMHRMWTLDKVARISTAAVVSTDELLRVFHRYGYEAVGQYIYDRGLYQAARAQGLLKAGKYNRFAGMEFLPPAARKRIQKLMDIPDRITSAEKLTWAKAGGAMETIEPGTRSYVAAARDWYRSFTSNEAFQMGLGSPEDFKAWWDSPAGKTDRLKVIETPDGPRTAEWQEVYEGLQNLQDALLYGVPKGKRQFVLDAMKEAIEDLKNGGQGYMSPDAFNYTPAVRGFKKGGIQEANMKSIMSGALDEAMEQFFMEPTNYRRGLLFNMAKEKEMDRLLSLYADQGREVLSNTQIMDALGLPPGSSVAQFPPDVFDALAKKNGFVPRRHLEQLAESRAMDEMDNVFYAWDKGSRGGQVARGAFPFGGPWADMWGFWGRELFSAPVIRGDFGNNQLLQSIQRGANKLPFDPRTAETISRFANTDFDITEGFAGEGGPDVDLSPIFFFPTEGNNAFSVLLPGLGVVPSVALDLLMERLVDPLEDPEGYQRLIDQVSEIIPSVQYTTGDWRSDLSGGGQISAAAKMGIGLAMQFNNVWATPAFLGDYSTEVDINRAMSASIAKEINEWLSMPSYEALDLNIIEMVNEAKDQAGQNLAGTTALRNIIPANVDWDDSAEQLQEVWFDVAQMAGLEVRSEFSNLSKEELQRDPQKMRQYANDIRTTYFKMDQFEKDQLLVEYPQLAVNLVSNWDWSPKGKRELGGESTKMYQVGGTQEDLARHQTYVQKGYVNPISPTAKAYRILGTVISSRRRLATTLYSQTAEKINDIYWESVVSDSDKGKLTLFLGEFGDRYGMEPGDERRLWDRWGSYGGEFEYQLSKDLEMDIDSDEFKETVEPLKLEQRAWSTSWPGVEEATSQYSKFPVGALDTDEDFVNAMRILGVDWDEDLTGEQFHQGLVDSMSYGAGLDAEVMPSYNDWVNDYASGPSAAEGGLNTLANNSRYDDDFRDQVKQFKITELETSYKIKDRGYTLATDLDTVRTKWRNLMVLSEEEDAMKKWWASSYENRYGPLDWEAPVPPQLRTETGELTSNAYTPIIRKIVDGDTLHVDNTAKNLFGEISTGEVQSVRLLGVRSRDFGIDDDGALEDRKALMDALVAAQRNGDRIYLVRDPEQFGSNTDRYGRELAWLYIGDEPWFSPDAFLPTD